MTDTKTKPKAAAKPAEKKEPTKAELQQKAAVEAQKEHDAELDQSAKKLDKVADKLEKAASDDTGDGSVNDPAVIAQHALDHFNAYRNHPYFVAIIDAA